ncbi:MAG: hypothetical protein IPF68_19720 [Bacteroidales bacterium]|nr:hypothetical protein [Bacteroidales bacterium]
MRWTISNGTCATSSDDITINFYQTPTTASAGSTRTFAALRAAFLVVTPRPQAQVPGIVSGGTGTFRQQRIGQFNL